MRHGGGQPGTGGGRGGAREEPGPGPDQAPEASSRPPPPPHPCGPRPPSGPTGRPWAGPVPGMLPGPVLPPRVWAPAAGGGQRFVPAPPTPTGRWDRAGAAPRRDGGGGVRAQPPGVLWKAPAPARRVRSCGCCVGQAERCWVQAGTAARSRCVFQRCLSRGCLSGGSRVPVAVPQPRPRSLWCPQAAGALLREHPHSQTRPLTAGSAPRDVSQASHSAPRERGRHLLSAGRL